MDDGVLYAAATSPSGSLDAVHHRDEVSGADQELFAITSEDGGWVMVGLWACGVRRLVAVGHEDGTEPVDLYHSASLNDTWLVWGSGSQAQASEMFATWWDSLAPGQLRLAPGYSRPVLAPQSDTVLVRRSDGMFAVSWDVATLSRPRPAAHGR